MTSKIEKWFINFIMQDERYIMPLYLIPLAIYYLFKWRNEYEMEK